MSPRTYSRAMSNVTRLLLVAVAFFAAASSAHAVETNLCPKRIHLIFEDIRLDQRFSSRLEVTAPQKPFVLRAVLGTRNAQSCVYYSPATSRPVAELYSTPDKNMLRVVSSAGNVPVSFFVWVSWYDQARFSAMPGERAEIFTRNFPIPVGSAAVRY